jgi:hypothetical protein
MDINIYKKVRVRLTPDGMKVFGNSWDKIIQNECWYRLEGRTLETDLYTLMSIFGEYLWNNSRDIFERDIIKISDE